MIIYTIPGISQSDVNKVINGSYTNPLQATTASRILNKIHSLFDLCKSYTKLQTEEANCLIYIAKDGKQEDSIKIIIFEFDHEPGAYAPIENEQNLITYLSVTPENKDSLISLLNTEKLAHEEKYFPNVLPDTKSLLLESDEEDSEEQPGCFSCFGFRR